MAPSEALSRRYHDVNLPVGETVKANDVLLH